MNYDDFIKLRNEANLTKEQFLELSETKMGTYNSWGTTRAGKKTPSWVKSWLKLYIENKRQKIVIEELKN